MTREQHQAAMSHLPGRGGSASGKAPLIMGQEGRNSGGRGGPPAYVMKQVV